MTTDMFPTQETITVIEFFLVLSSTGLALRFSTALAQFCTFAEAAQPTIHLWITSAFSISLGGEQEWI